MMYRPPKKMFQICTQVHEHELIFMNDQLWGHFVDHYEEYLIGWLFGNEWFLIHDHPHGEGSHDEPMSKVTEPAAVASWNLQHIIDIISWDF